MIIYFIGFGDTFSSLIVNFFSSVTEEDFFGQRKAYIIILTALLIPIIIKK